MTHDMPDTVISECIANIDSIEITNFAGSIPPYSVSWEFGSTDNPSAIPPSSTSQSTVEYIVEMMDGCGDLFYDTLTYITDQTLDITNMISNNTSSCAADGWVSATVAGETGTPLLHWTGPGNPGQNNVDGSVMQDLPSGWYYFSVSDDVCSFNDSTYVEEELPPIAEFSANLENGCNPLTVIFTNTSQNTVEYNWDFGDGSTTSNSFEPNHTFTQSTVVTLTATDAFNCSDEATVTINISNCGCTDPEAVNYDPTAVVDNGDCIYPIPSVTGPNVFTPNNDNDNDVFFLTHQNATSITLTVLNRWGNVMHESTTDLTDPMARAEWDGKTKGGLSAEEGTYFYKYVAIGVDGSEIEGHGFVQLLP
jgi:gliding motility-associated-like protein